MSAGGLEGDDLQLEVTWDVNRGVSVMSTPTGTNPDERAETKKYGAELAIDLARLEVVMARLERELWPTRLPPVSHLPPVPGLTGEPLADDVRPPPAWLKPGRAMSSPKTKPDHSHASWAPVMLVVAALIGLPIGYFIGSSSPQPVSLPQLAAAAIKPVALPVPAPASLPVLARDDTAEHPDAGDTASPTGVLRTAKPPGRMTVAMVKSDDRVGATPAPPKIPALDAETIALLTQQGEQLAEAGDFAAARTLFQRAAEAGHAAAATALGATYDPTVLAEMRAVGINADLVKARFWYEKAASLGSFEARRRLELLANR